MRLKALFRYSNTPIKRILCLAPCSLRSAFPPQHSRRRKFPGSGTCVALSSRESTRIGSLQGGLGELGYVKEKTVPFSTGGRKENRPAPDIAAELLRLKVDVIVTGGPTATLPATFMDSLLESLKLSEERQ